MRIKMHLKDGQLDSMFTWYNEFGVIQLLIVTPADILEFDITDKGEVELITTISDYRPAYDISEIEEVFEPIYKYETTIKIDRPRSEWVREGIKYKCAHCKNTVRKPTDFCPNCGRDMRESQI